MRTRNNSSVVHQSNVAKYLNIEICVSSEELYKRAKNFVTRQRNFSYSICVCVNFCSAYWRHSWNKHYDCSNLFRDWISWQTINYLGQRFSMLLLLGSDFRNFPWSNIYSNHFLLFRFVSPSFQALVCAVSVCMVVCSGPHNYIYCCRQHLAILKAANKNSKHEFHTKSNKVCIVPIDYCLSQQNWLMQCIMRIWVCQRTAKEANIWASAGN